MAGKTQAKTDATTVDVPTKPNRPRRSWDDAEVPPLWVWLAGSVAVVGIAFLIIWKIGDSMSEARVAAPPPSAISAAASKNTD